MDNTVEAASLRDGYLELRDCVFDTFSGDARVKLVVLRSILERWCCGTPSLVDFLVDQFIRSVGYNEGDVVSDIRPDEWLMQLGMHDEYDRFGVFRPEGPQYGIFEREGARYFEGQALFFGGMLPGVADREERNQRWRDEFASTYGESFSVEWYREEGRRRQAAYLARAKAR